MDDMMPGLTTKLRISLSKWMMGFDAVVEEEVL